MRFWNSNVHITPKKYGAMLYSYINQTIFQPSKLSNKGNVQAHTTGKPTAIQRQGHDKVRIGLLMKQLFVHFTLTSLKPEILLNSLLLQPSDS